MHATFYDLFQLSKMLCYISLYFDNCSFACFFFLPVIRLSFSEIMKSKRQNWTPQPLPLKTKSGIPKVHSASLITVSSKSEFPSNVQPCRHFGIPAINEHHRNMEKHWSCVVSLTFGSDVNHVYISCQWKTTTKI